MSLASTLRVTRIRFGGRKKGRAYVFECIFNVGITTEAEINRIRCGFFFGLTRRARDNETQFVAAALEQLITTHIRNVSFSQANALRLL